MKAPIRVSLLSGLLALFAPVFAADSAPVVRVGVAKVDITPDTPIRLSGYGNRTTETSEVAQRLFARALAIGGDRADAAVVIAAELVGISEEVRDAVAAALERSHGIPAARVAVCCTHTHTGPATAGNLPYMFSKDLPADEQARIARYTEGLKQKFVQAATEALAAREPGRLGWAEGRVGFTGQRRVITKGKWTAFGRDPNGPADYALPVMQVTDRAGKVRGVFLSYACHCTTLTGTHNFIHGDWAGEASAQIESAHPGAVALVAIGCGADANPQPRGTIENVVEHGREVVGEVARLLAGPQRPLGPVTAASYRRIELELDRVVTREELQERVNTSTRAQIKYAASQFLAGLDAGRPIPRAVPYPIQTWTFGSELAMVFLAGEVVSEYSLRLRRELDGRRLWVNAYANGVPCYIASKAMYEEGGYEVDGSMDYYGWPTRLAIGTEDKIVGTVHAMLPRSFAAPK